MKMCQLKLQVVVLYKSRNHTSSRDTSLSLLNNDRSSPQNNLSDHFLHSKHWCHQTLRVKCYPSVPITLLHFDPLHCCVVHKHHQNGKWRNCTDNQTPVQSVIWCFTQTFASLLMCLSSVNFKSASDCVVNNWLSPQASQCEAGISACSTDNVQPSCPVLAVENSGCVLFHKLTVDWLFHIGEATKIDKIYIYLSTFVMS